MIKNEFLTGSMQANAEWLPSLQYLLVFLPLLATQACCEEWKCPLYKKYVLVE